MTRSIKIGSPVKYVDEFSVEHDALVTETWGNREYDDTKGAPSLNIVYVVKDPAMKDQYGSQIKHDTSVVHRTVQTAHGRYWYQP